MRIIIDTDAGVDDAQAIMLALSHPGATVEAITTATGNVHVDKVIPNVFTVLDVAKKDVPVCRGADRPLIAPWEPEESVHGEDGMGNWKARPSSQRKLDSEHAVLALLRLANEFPGELTLVTLGPLTNIALAARLDPSFPGKIKQFVFMGGTIAAIGNTPMVTAEWNIYCDPEAAYIALEAFPEATMVSWETTIHHPLTWQQYDMLAASQTDAGRFFHGITSENAVLYRQMRPGLGYLVPDPLAMAVTLDPGLIRKSEHHFVTVELQGAHTRGQTVIDYLDRQGKPPNVHVVTELDTGGIFELFKRTFAG